MKKIWIWLVKKCGWHFDIPDKKERPEVMHCVVVVAPHTSFDDFLIGAAVLWAAGSKPRIFVKKEYFNFLTRPLLKGMGLVPVDRGNRHNNLVPRAVELLKEENDVCVVITPEATRKPVKRFKRGFYEIATQAGVPIMLGFMDFKEKRAGYGPTIIPSGDYEADLAKMMDFFRPVHPKHPEGWYWSEQQNDNQ
jgi:1-acyl-sn-glycerol-3-phosphate acyltransferase